MPKKASAETQLRGVRAELKHINGHLDKALVDATTYRARATKAEQELAEWKRRFDLLLERTPKVEEGA